MRILVRNLDGARNRLLLELLGAGARTRVATLRAHLPYLLRGHILLIYLGQVLQDLLHLVHVGRVLILLHIHEHLLVDLLNQVQLF